MGDNLLLLAAWSSFAMAPSPQHASLSRVGHGDIYWGKAWQMQEPNARSLDGFLSSVLPAVASACTAGSLLGHHRESSHSLPGQHSTELLWF